ncbi:hypothetical protein Syun_007810 [Stephania yunnanensis]|uniref:Glutaredoxin domain-containing protein n=1 Tax=Stephania yunnanensis TaxID=152371 RepID=A0AAP0Q0L2_9MAGN
MSNTSVKELAKKRAVVVFSRSSCCMCYTIQRLFSDLSVNAAVHELDQEPNGRELESQLKKLGCNPVVPAVFIGGEFVGGTNEVMELHLSGSLVPWLRRVGAIWL